MKITAEFDDYVSIYINGEMSGELDLTDEEIEYIHDKIKEMGIVIIEGENDWTFKL